MLKQNNRTRDRALSGGVGKVSESHKLKKIAFDRSNRSIDPIYGYMRVSNCVLTAESVDPYFGNEVPNWDELGLNPEKIYNVYRPLSELEKALPSFEGLPLLFGHEQDSADDPLKDKRVGAVMNDLVIDGLQVKGSISIQDRYAIECVNEGSVSDLSCAYYYVPVVESGDWNGTPYDIKMTDIHGNHVALVAEGRVEGAMVADQSKIGLKGKIMGLLEDLKSLLKDTDADKDEKRLETAKELGIDKDDKAEDDEAGEVGQELYALIDKIEDTDLAGQIRNLVDSLRESEGEEDREESEDEEDIKVEVEEDSDVDKRREKDMAGDGKKSVVSRKSTRAVSSQKIASDAKAQVISELRDIHEAVKNVRPIVGDLDPFAFDRPSDVYRLALEQSGINPRGYKAEAYKGMVDILNKTAKDSISADWNISGKSAAANDGMPKHIQKTTIRG